MSRLKNFIITYYVLIRQFLKAKKLLASPQVVPNGEGLVIVPCDPETIIGSRGDEAMICAVINEFRSREPLAPIYMIGQNAVSTQYVSNAKIDENILILECWNQSYPLEIIYKKILGLKPKEAVIIGADCMDGAYSPSLSVDLMTCYNLLRKSGIHTCLTGFSYNKTPHPFLNYMFHKFRDTPYNIRDVKSYERFRSKTNAKGVLVADVAFLLKPNTDVTAYTQLINWVSKNKVEGKRIIAFNFHPMLRQYANEKEMESDACVVAENIKSILHKYSEISIVLLPHDDRSRVNDATMLNIVYSKIKLFGLNNRVYYQKKVPHASQLKYIASLMDGVISSRMHLAIAALGSCVPVLVADYQGKFEGLFDHFSLPHTYILSADVFCSETFMNKFELFYRNLDEIKAQIESKIDAVLNLAKNNFK